MYCVLTVRFLSQRRHVHACSESGGAGGGNPSRQAQLGADPHVPSPAPDGHRQFVSSVRPAVHGGDPGGRYLHQRYRVDSATPEMCGQAIYPATVMQGEKEESAARLSGCKNIVEAVPAGNAVTLPRWGLTLDCGKAVPADVRWAGIRAHHVTAAPEGTEGAFHCAVERVIQDVFTTIVLLRPEHAAPDAPPLRMELNREDWYALNRPESLWISVQPRDILLLK